METVSQGSGNARSTSLVLLNTRVHRGYRSVQEMLKPGAELPWGNHFAFLNIPIPKLRDAEARKNPLQFVLKARKVIKRRRSSFGVYLTAKYLQLVGRFSGPKVWQCNIYYLNNTTVPSNSSSSEIMDQSNDLLLD